MVIYSDKPLYARLALAPEGQQVLSLVFDEKQGTGRGYDRVGWDRNFDGQFGAEEVMESELRDLGYLQQWLFSGSPLPGKVLNKGLDEARVQLQLVALNGELLRVSLNLRITVGEEPEQWEYNFTGPLPTGPDLAEAPLVSLWPLAIATTAVPDPLMPEAIGLALSHRGGHFRLNCRGGAGAQMVQVVVKDEQGGVVHDEWAHMGRFAFG